MREIQSINDLEKSLSLLMPAARSVSAVEELDSKLYALSGESEVKPLPSYRKWMAVAALFGFGLFVASQYWGRTENSKEVAKNSIELLGITDRIQAVHDAGLYLDTGGSAVRKIQFEVIEESKIRDEETGLEITLTSPRKETYLVPISTF